VPNLKTICRSLLRQPFFLLSTILTLALTIGTTITFISLVNGILIRPLPLKDASRLVMLWESNPSQGQPRFPVSPLTFRAWKRESQAFTTIAAFRDWGFRISGRKDPNWHIGALVSSDFFDVFGLQTAHGRTWIGEEPERVVVLGWSLARRLFGPAHGATGQFLTLNGERYSVIGVLPEDFSLGFLREAQIFAPLALDPDQRKATSDMRNLWVFGRLKENATILEARAEVGAISRNLEQALGAEESGWGADVVSLHEMAVGDNRLALLLLAGAAAFVLLLACVNLANLLLARATSRIRESAIRRALGETRFSQAGRFLTESALLCLAGGGCGMLVAYGQLNVLKALNPGNISRLHEVSIDTTALLLASAISILAALTCGLLPALQASMPDLSMVVTGTRGVSRTGAQAKRWRGLLVTSQQSLALVLLIGALLVTGTFLNLHNADLGFRSQGLLTMRLSLAGSAYGVDEQRVPFYRRALERIESLGGVESASIVSTLPLSGSDDSVEIEGAGYGPLQAHSAVAHVRQIGIGYFRTMGIPLIRGRDFHAHERALRSDAVVINEAMARRFWPGGDPVGEGLALGGSWNGRSLRIVGVAGNVKHFGPRLGELDEVYMPIEAHTRSLFYLAVRSGSKPLELADSVRKGLRTLDPELVITDIRSMKQRLDRLVSQPRLHMIVLNLFTLLALVLGVVGVYGLSAELAHSRTREFAIRTALGADRAKVFVLAIKWSLQPTLLGSAIGLAVGLGMSQLFTTLLFGVEPGDPQVLFGAVGILTLVSMLASITPALAVARLDPIRILRHE